MGFNGFPKDTTKFLVELHEHNTREWFTADKTRYKESIEAPAKDFLDAASDALSIVAGQPLAGKIFRIYRDVRFSKDKTPYNTHIRVLFHSLDVDSTCGNHPVFCFSLERDRVITGTGTGTMEFSKSTLDAFREAVADNKRGKALEKLLAKYSPADGYRIDPPALKRMPAGYDNDHPREALLRHKALMVWHEAQLTPEVYTPKFIPGIVQRYKKMKPVYDWINTL